MTIVLDLPMLLVVFCWLSYYCCFCFADDLISSSNLHKHYKTSCYNAKLVNFGSGSFCPFVDWRTANLYEVTSSFTVYDPGPQLSIDAQDSVAGELSESLVSKLSSSSTSAECNDAVQWFTCVLAFPLCPQVGLSFSSYSHFPPCKALCQQVNSACGETVVNCDGLRVSENCMMYVAPDSVLLDPALGPYGGLELTYTALLVAWLLAAAVWLYLCCCRYAEETAALAVCRVAIAVPLLRVVALALAVAFWSRCTARGAVTCDRLLATPLFSLFHIAESVEVFVFLLLAKGWGFTRPALPIQTWRWLCCLVFAFYMVTSIVSSLRLSTPSLDWAMYTAVVYGFYYWLILHSALEEMSTLYQQARKLTARMPAVASRPLTAKYEMYLAFLVLVLLVLSLEASCQVLHALRVLPFRWLVLLFESAHLLLLALLGWVFRPRHFSPFFYMQPTSLQAPPGSLRAAGSRRHDADDVDMQLRYSQAHALRPTPLLEVLVGSWGAGSGGSSGDRCGGHAAGTVSDAAAAVVVEGGSAGRAISAGGAGDLGLSSRAAEEFELTPLLQQLALAGGGEEAEHSLAAGQGQGQVGANAAALASLRNLGNRAREGPARVGTGGDPPGGDGDSDAEEGNGSSDNGSRDGDGIGRGGRRAGGGTIAWLWELLGMGSAPRRGRHEQLSAGPRPGLASSASAWGGGLDQDHIRLVAVRGADCEVFFALHRSPLGLLHRGGWGGTGRWTGAAGVMGELGVAASNFARSLVNMRSAWRAGAAVGVQAAPHNAP